MVDMKQEGCTLSTWVSVPKKSSSAAIVFTHGEGDGSGQLCASEGDVRKFGFNGISLECC